MERIQEQFVQVFEWIEEQIGDILVPPIVEGAVEVGQNFALERMQQRTVEQTVVAPALQGVAPLPDVAVGDTGFDSSWNVHSSLRGHSHWRS